MSYEDEKKFEEIVNGSHRKEGEPINIQRLIEIADKLEKLEAETRREELVGTYAQ